MGVVAIFSKIISECRNETRKPIRIGWSERKESCVKGITIYPYLK